MGEGAILYNVNPFTGTSCTAYRCKGPEPSRGIREGRKRRRAELLCSARWGERASAASRSMKSMLAARTASFMRFRPRKVTWCPRLSRVWPMASMGSSRPWAGTHTIANRLTFFSPVRKRIGRFGRSHRASFTLSLFLEV